MKSSAHVPMSEARRMLYTYKPTYASVTQGESTFIIREEFETGLKKFSREMHQQIDTTCTKHIAVLATQISSLTPTINDVLIPVISILAANQPAATDAAPPNLQDLTTASSQATSNRAKKKKTGNKRKVSSPMESQSQSDAESTISNVDFQADQLPLNGEHLQENLDIAAETY